MKILLIEDDGMTRLTFSRYLEEWRSVAVITAGGPREFRQKLADHSDIALVITDYNLESPRDRGLGATIVEYTRRNYPTLPIIVVSGDHYTAQSDPIIAKYGIPCIPKDIVGIKEAILRILS